MHPFHVVPRRRSRCKRTPVSSIRPIQPEVLAKPAVLSILFLSEKGVLRRPDQDYNIVCAKEYTDASIETTRPEEWPREGAGMAPSNFVVPTS